MFNLTKFDEFCSDLWINTKEMGRIQLGKHWLGTQRYALEQIKKGIDEGVHDFLILKGRQFGISTGLLALDMYWLQENPGLQGTIVTHDDDSREQFRMTLTMYYEGLSDDWQLGIVRHNSSMLLFENESMLLYRVSGVRKGNASAKLGRSASPSLVHGTEVAFWSDPGGVASLRSSLSERNPNRLYVWESTANGFNHFYTMAEAAKHSISQRFIFIGWWTNQLYRCDRGSDMWNAYWGKSGMLTTEEKQRAKAVKLLYGVNVTPEQVAWYRWYETEKVSGDTDRAQQEMPWTEHEAFISTGSKFFSSRCLSECYRRIKSQEKPDYYRIQFHSTFQDTYIIACPKKNATLEIYEEPERGAFYVMGADPAYGSSTNADRFVSSIWRCYSDRIVQVAEFVDHGLEDHQFAWVMVYLAGAYNPCVYNLEINGPGQVVDNEIRNMRRQVLFGGSPADVNLRAVLANIRTFFWTRPDSLVGGPTARHTISSQNVMERYMGEFRDYAERGMAEVHSEGLVQEMERFERTESGSLEAGQTYKDDRCIAAGLAIMAWNDQLRTVLMQRGISWQAAQDSNRHDTPAEDKISATVSKYLEAIGVRKSSKPEIPGVKSGRPAVTRSGSPAYRSRGGRVH